MGIRQRRLWIVISCIMCILFGGCGTVADSGMEEILEEEQILETDETVLTMEEPLVEQATSSPMEQQVTDAKNPVQVPQVEAEPEIVEVLGEPAKPQATQMAEMDRNILKEEDSVRIQVTEGIPVPENTQEPTSTPTSTSISISENIHESVSTPTCADITEPMYEEQQHSSEEIQEDVEILENSSSKEEVHVHNFEKAIWELPTCQKGGYYNNICTGCGQVECVTQDALPHETEDIIIQQGNCMNDTVIQHVCANCGVNVSPDTRYTEYNIHQWIREMVDGQEIEYCQDCGVQK